MPICKHCNKRFPNRIVISGVRRNIHNRRYCLQCSPWHKHNTGKIGRILKGQSTKCTVCGSDYIYKKTDGSLPKTCTSCNSRIAKQKKKQKCVEYKGSKCILCGYSKCIKALEFHHLDPKKKDFTISNRLGLKWEKLKKELDKCVILCCLCHVEVHEGIKTVRV
jgi:hypothetical protein